MPNPIPANAVSDEAAPPPTPAEIERKLSIRSIAPPSRSVDSPKKPRKLSHTLQQNPHVLSGNESDSSIASSIPGLASPNLSVHPTSPLLTPATTSVGGLSAIAERKFGGDEEIDPMMDLEDVEEEEEEGAESGSEDGEGQAELERRMEGERVIKSGYLWKKQEKRRAWKKRWFVLRTGKLAYYKDDKEYSLKKVVDLTQIHTVAPVDMKKHNNAFGIVVPKRTYFVKASTTNEVEEWVHDINEMRRRLSEKEEEERGKREKGESGNYAPKTTSMPIPAAPRMTPSGLHAIDTISPTNASSYFADRTVSSPQPMSSTAQTASSVFSPSSPIDHSLTTQFAKLSTGRSPSAQSALGQSRVPSGISSAARGASGSTNREPSASSVSSAGRAGNVSAVMAAPPVSSEDEDEVEGSETPLAVIDPTKVILQTYLMKQSRRRKDVWRKRYFTLTSAGLAYAKSHMDKHTQNIIPLTSILDALEVVDDSSASDGNDSDRLSFHGHTHPSHHPQSPASRPFMRGRLGSSTVSTEIHKKPSSSSQQTHQHQRKRSPEEHVFRVITAKRTYHLCAPSEEDEIKWLAAVKALLERQRQERAGWSGFGISSPLAGSGVGAGGGGGAAAGAGGVPQRKMSVPFITQQPPTPAGPSPLSLSLSPSIVSTSAGPPSPSGETPAAATSAGPPAFPTSFGQHGQQGQGQAGGRGQAGQGQGQVEQEVGVPTMMPPPAAASGSGSGTTTTTTTAQRTRSATYTAKSAVADVVRRFHPERERGE
ncbi:hypothetical protein I350_06208 [Cryptococcus amylolentus CBS 6273]|uniref:PH domain-containing protein n=1 Tax=Cryptococcus amylolentus CBS 6273 TaxID=1296118 RepID=A0A1E3JKI7_9TREE|nr:hypothetical protein I350_06208 [Cryptococcus amylolentus CBS 6273]